MSTSRKHQEKFSYIIESLYRTQTQFNTLDGRINKFINFIFSCRLQDKKILKIYRNIQILLKKFALLEDQGLNYSRKETNRKQ